MAANLNEGPLVKIGMGVWVNPDYVIGVVEWIGHGSEEGLPKGSKVWTELGNYNEWWVSTGPEEVVQLINRETYWTEDDDLAASAGAGQLRTDDDSDENENEDEDDSQPG